MDRVNKSLLGYKVDENGVYVVLNNDEYEEFKYKLDELEEKCLKYERELRQKLEIIERRNREIQLKTEEIDKLKNSDLNSKIEKLKSEKLEILTKAKKNLELGKNFQEKLKVEKLKNENLFRIMKERSNAQRGLKPKKTRFGYIALDNKKINYKIKYKNFNKFKYKNIEAYKIRLQTPYISSALDIYDARDKIINDICYVGVGSELPIDGIFYKDEYSLDEFDDSVTSKKEESICFDLKFIANYKSGFWEVDVYTNRFINVSDEFIL